jgi:DNA helicase II / ATP-dependent DNA helicase PcrA
MLFKITNEDIQYTEQILFGRTGEFDEERLTFIKNFHTIDLQAVPGSGKTTALMAKLIILERHLPFLENQGVLVISHTNTAVNEIKEIIANYCPRLFAYPNFVGTIQSFVDQFLTSPYYCICEKKKIYRINNEAYQEALDRSLKNCLPGKTREIFTQVLHIRNTNPALISNYRLKLEHDGTVTLVKSINNTPLEIKKPKPGSRNYSDYSDEQKRLIKEYLLALKMKILHEGVMCYDDAYYLAARYLSKYPIATTLLQKRFNYVFVDEMQDMDIHQINILDKIFLQLGNPAVTYQRIGDKNQSIYNGEFPQGDVWNSSDRPTLTLSGSKRFHPLIADIVRPFGVTPTNIVGNDQIAICKPILLLYDDSTIESVIPYFPLLITEHAKANNISVDSSCKIKAVAWVKNSDNTCLKSYFSQLDPLAKVEKKDFKNLLSYLSQNFSVKKGLAEIRKSILNAILKLCRIENLRISNQAYYTKAAFINFCKTKSVYKEFTLKLFNWCDFLYKHQSGKVHQIMRSELPGLLKEIFGHTQLSRAGLSFIEDSDIEFPTASEEEEKISTNYVCPATGINVEIGTVHSVKGETHFATLYLESKFQGHTESQRLLEQLLGTNFNEQKVYHKQSARMMYVGLSRAQQVLIFACHIDNVKDHLDTLNKRWNVNSTLLKTNKENESAAT